MRRYETIFILRPSLSEKEVDTLIENTTQLINSDSGVIIDVDRWGMRKLAYLIKKEKQGYYVLADFCAPPATVAEMERKFRIDDAVLKYMTVKMTDSINQEEIDTARQAIEDKKAAKKAAEEAALAENQENEEATEQESKGTEEKTATTNKAEAAE